MNKALMGAVIAMALLVMGCATERTATQDDTARARWTDVKEEARETGAAAADAVEHTANDMGLATAAQGTFKEEMAFELEGQLMNPRMGAVTIVRQDLPPAVLDVRDETKVLLDGNTVMLEDIPEGAAVRAHFQLEGNETVAVKIEAKSNAAAK